MIIAPCPYRQSLHTRLIVYQKVAGSIPVGPVLTLWGRSSMVRASSEKRLFQLAWSDKQKPYKKF
ncbi:MAG: hypothetical protein HY819_06335 [Acidobacteria bacterium]|nr:hypothetical protein [Acidobacteriota bacterium]